MTNLALLFPLFFWPPTQARGKVGMMVRLRAKERALVRLQGFRGNVVMTDEGQE